MCEKLKDDATFVKIDEVLRPLCALVCDFQGCKGEEETGPCGVRVPGESLLGGSQTSGENALHSFM